MLCTLALGALSPGWAQSPGPAADAPLRLPVVVVDQERLFNESLYGQRVLADIDSRSERLAAENRAIEAELIAEERDLTERRKTMPPAEFREAAAEFDERVSALRAEQDAKLRVVSRLRDEARQTFFGLIGPVLRDILAERDALVLLDRRAVISAVDAADITTLAIRRIDAEIGDGANAVAPD